MGVVVQAQAVVLEVFRDLALVLLRTAPSLASAWQFTNFPRTVAQSGSLDAFDFKQIARLVGYVTLEVRTDMAPCHGQSCNAEP